MIRVYSDGDCARGIDRGADIKFEKLKGVFLEEHDKAKMHPNARSVRYLGGLSHDPLFPKNQFWPKAKNNRKTDPSVT